MKMQVALSYDDVDNYEAMRWAKKYCPSYTSNHASYDRDNRIVVNYCFCNEKDAIAFTLRWS